MRNPRVSNEMITPCKGFFESGARTGREAYLADPMKLDLHGLPKISVWTRIATWAVPITSGRVWKARTADAQP